MFKFWNLSLVSVKFIWETVRERGNVNIVMQALNTNNSKKTIKHIKID